MSRQTSTPLRAVRALVALVTVWCTGCSGFEPLVDAARGLTGDAMVCATEMNDARIATSSAASVAGASDAGAITAASAPSEQGYDCGCASCHAVAQATWDVMPIAPAVPQAVALQPRILVSVGRAPLLPPPERTL